jgi:CheY-like chemotaxis protein
MPHKLLLADDSVTIQRVIELTFADEDVQVVVVSDGRQAIERVRAEQFDIVLADIGMPERDVYEVAAFIKGEPGLAHIPVVLLTGAFEPLDENRARAVKSDAVLVKPFEPQMVINRVKELLAARRPSGVPAPSHLPAHAAAAPPSSGRAQAPGSTPSSVTRSKAAGDALEDYFDRLDVAFSNIGAPPSNTGSRFERDDVSVGLGDRPPAAVGRTPEPPDPMASWDPDLAGDFALVEPAAEPALEPAVEPAVAPVHQPELADAFAALLAAEEGHAVSHPFAISAPAVISEDTIEEIVRRVIARMADESMRRAVVDTAERLVRDEIDRIKRAGSPGSTTGSGS